MKTWLKRVELRCRLASGRVLASVDVRTIDNANDRVRAVGPDAWMPFLNLHPLEERGGIMPPPEGVSWQK